MPRYSIFGYYGHGNAGDEAILAALNNGLKNQIPNAKVCAYSANPEDTTLDHQIESYKFFSLDPISFIKGIFGRRRKSYIASLYNFLKTDIVIIGGGGIFYDAPDENRWVVGYTKLIKTAKLFGKKVAIVGVSVGPIHNEESGKAIAQAFVITDFISVRDNSSKKLLIEYRVPAEKIQIVPDLVFTLDSCNDSRVKEIFELENFEFSTRKKIIALTPCCYNKNKPGWLTQYISFCRRATKELEAIVILVPMQKNGVHSDYDATQEIFNNLDENTQKCTFLLQGTYTAQEIQGILSSADFILAERLHGSIMAINTATPFKSIAYMPKVNGVLDLAKLNDHMISMNDFLSGKYETKTIELIKSSVKINEKLILSRDEARNRANENFSSLKNIYNV
jgi:polysaccharide pyruvyl transferase WcaK-like protein